MFKVISDRSELKELVRSSVEETLNGMLEAEAEQLNMNVQRDVKGTEAAIQPQSHNDLRRRYAQCA